MTTIAPAGLVLGATRTPLPFGLFSTFSFRPEGGDRWGGGVSWQRLICDPVQGIGALDCDDTATVIGLPKQLDRNGQGDDTASPFIVYGHFACSPVGSAAANAQTLATQHLLMREEARVEQAFWTGDLGNWPHLANSATDDDPTEILAGGTAMDPVAAVALLEDYIGSQYGSQGVIHMSRGMAVTAHDAVVSTGNGTRLQTIVGTPVAAGAGYPGTGPDGTAAGPNSTWIYASPAVFGYRSEVLPSSNRDGDLFDRSQNELVAIAERAYLLGYDGCGVAAVKVKTA